MKGWERSGDTFVADLTQQEAAVIRGMVSQIRDMLVERADEAPQDELAELTGIRTGPSSAPDDRIMARLLPDFHRAGPDGELEPSEANSAAALRSLHEPALLDAKTQAADVVLETCPYDGGQARITQPQASAWLAALNDVRLALGTALDIGEDTPDELPPEDPRSAHLGVYQWLTWVQDKLIEALSDGRA